MKFDTATDLKHHKDSLQHIKHRNKRMVNLTPLMQAGTTTETAATGTKRQKVVAETEIKFGLGSRVDILHSDNLWYCGTVKAVFPVQRQVKFADGEGGDSGRRLTPNEKEWRCCTHHPQRKNGSKT